MHLADLYLFLASMLIGALIGTERQRKLEEEGKKGVAGLRTFTLIALLGTLSATIAETYGPTFMAVAFAGFLLLLAASYAASTTFLSRLDFTGAMAAAVTYCLGALCYNEENILLAVSLAILTTVVLATKKITHRYVEEISDVELLDTLKMGIIALVIYPLLPNETLDPFDVLNPRQIWLMVVLVSLISYVGYILIKVLGAERGLPATGILGGLVSSTAVTTTMASEVRANRGLLPSAVFATVIAGCIMFPRVLLITLVVNRDIFFPLLPVLGSMTLAGVALAYTFFRRETLVEKEVELRSPFMLAPALKFGAFFALILLTSKLASTYFGDAGVYIASLIAGLADVDAITLSMTTLAGTTITLETAVIAITLATMTNTLVKLSIAYMLGTREFGNRIAAVFVPMIIVGLVAILVF